MVLGLRKVTIIEKLSNLLHFNCFSSKAWFFSMMCLNFRKNTSKNEVYRFFKATVLYFESNLLPQKGEGDLHKSYSWTKNFFGG